MSEEIISLCVPRSLAAIAAERPTLFLPHAKAAERFFDFFRAKQAGIKTKVGNHSLRATRITDYLKSSGTLEHAQAMANHSSPRTTKLYDRRNDGLTLDEYERVGI